MSVRTPSILLRDDACGDFPAIADLVRAASSSPELTELLCGETTGPGATEATTT